MGKIATILNNIKNGKKEEFILLLDEFEPLIKKYIKCLYKDECEDARSELICALWEAVVKITYFEQDGQVINYLCSALRNRYLELYRSSCKQHNHEVNLEETQAEQIAFIKNEFDDAAMLHDIDRFLEKFTGNKRKIYNAIMTDHLSDTEIAAKYHISRQYTNRVRKELRKVILQTL